MKGEEENTEDPESKIGEVAPPTRPSKRRAAKKPAKAKARKAAKPKAPKKAEKAVKPVKPAQVEAKAEVKPVSPVDVKELLKLRESIRKGRPKFLRHESWRYVRLETSWRKPKGIDNKMRKMVKGWPRIVKVGYRAPAAARGLHPSGFRDVLVSTVEELERLSPETEAARLSATLGARKRLEMIKRAEELGLKVLNLRGLRPLKPKE